MLSWGLCPTEKARKQQERSRPVISRLANRGSSRPKIHGPLQRCSESIDYCGLRLRRRAVSRYWPSIHFPPGCSERSLDSAPTFPK